MSKLIVRGTEPREVIPLFLAELRSYGERGNRQADWIEDVYSEVLFGLRQNNVKDPTMVKWLMEACLNHLNDLPDKPSGCVFAENEPGEWGWWNAQR